jgi:hypothetical protein
LSYDSSVNQVSDFHLLFVHTEVVLKTFILTPFRLLPEVFELILEPLPGIGDVELERSNLVLKLRDQLALYDLEHLHLDELPVRHRDYLPPLLHQERVEVWLQDLVERIRKVIPNIGQFRSAHILLLGHPCDRQHEDLVLEELLTEVLHCVICLVLVMVSGDHKDKGEDVLVVVDAFSVQLGQVLLFLELLY